MKKLLITLVLMMGIMTIKAADPVKQWGQLQVKGTQLCDQKGNPVVLRGVSLGWHNLWPRFYNKKAIKWLKQDWHPTVVRAAMGVMIEDNYLENPDFALKCIEPVIQAAIKENLYVIVDWHSHKLLTDDACKFFSMIAKKYGRHPHVIYELYNEPVNDSWDDLKAYADACIKTIRQYDPDNVILMGCPHWDQDVHIVADSPMQGYNNLMYTLHFYAATHKQQLRDRMTDVVKRGIPIFVSECAGMEASGDGPLNEAEWQAWVDCMETNGISYACWSLSDKNETCSMLLPRAKATGQWTPDLIKPWGKMVRETLRRFNP
jgi:endoglucanase